MGPTKANSTLSALMIKFPSHCNARKYALLPKAHSFVRAMININSALIIPSLLRCQCLCTVGGFVQVKYAS